jgi:pimeloyl-ACP methyl ester carboxylesterase
MKPLPRQAFDGIYAMMNTLVMIPAFGCNAELYQPQMAALSPFVRIQIIIPTDNRFELMVEDVLKHAPENFAILGTSMGGRLALEVALAAPERVVALCIIGAGAGAVSDRKAGLQRTARIRAGEKQRVIAEMAEKIAYQPGARGPEVQQAFIRMAQGMADENLAQQSDALAHRADLWEYLDEIECPTLCLWGEHDQFSPASDGQRIAEAVQYGSYIELQDCGHFPTLEYPDIATAAIAGWLDDIDDVGEDLD